MKVFIGADHQGFHLKELLFAHLAKRNFTVEDIGNKELDPQDDFPEFAQMAVMKVLGEEESEDPRAILICGGGQGMAMTANRFRGIRASVIWDAHEAKMTRRDNNSNILCLPARIMNDNEQLWKDIVDTWLSEDYLKAPRFERRNTEMDAI